MVKQDNQLSDNNSREALKKALLSFCHISDEAFQKIAGAFEPVQYEKNFIILNVGDIQQYTYFVLSGAVKVSYFKEDREIIDRFAEEGDFLGNLHGYQTKSPSQEMFESIEKVELLRMRYTDVESLLHFSAELSSITQKMQSISHAVYKQRTQNLKSLSAEKKYHLFVTEHPKQVNRIPLKYIANYLGFTPETLSRVRANYDKSHQA